MAILLITVICMIVLVSSSDERMGINGTTATTSTTTTTTLNTLPRQPQTSNDDTAATTTTTTSTTTNNNNNINFNGSATRQPIPPPKTFLKSIDYNTAEIARHSINTTIPHVFHFTTPNKSAIQDFEYYNINHCMVVNPNYMTIVYDNEDVKVFVRNHFPTLLDFFLRLETPVMRADVFRYLVLHRHGGIYMDSDVDCMKPTDEWIRTVERNNYQRDTNPATPLLSESTIRLIVGTEINRRKNKDVEEWFQICTWTIASVPGHGVLMSTVSKIISAVHSPKTATKDEVFKTGPWVFTDSVLEVISTLYGVKHFLSFGGKLTKMVTMIDSSLTHQGYALFDDVLILGINAFGSGQGHSGSTLNRNHSEILVTHGFFGGWKKGRKRKPVHAMTWNEYVAFIASEARVKTEASLSAFFTAA